MSELTRLQREVADHILKVIHQDELAAGTKLNENSLAKRLNVSRTPVRAALAHLADQGIVSRSRDQGVEVIKPPSRTVRVGAVSDAIWNTAGGVIAANRMLEELAAMYGVRD